MKYGTIVTQPGFKQRWVVGFELTPVTGQTAKRKSVWHFPKAEDFQGLVYRHTHNQFLYCHPDGRIFEAWIAL